MSLKDLDINNCEIRFSTIANVFQGNLVREERITVYDKLTDEEFVVDKNDIRINHIIQNAKADDGFLITFDGQIYLKLEEKE